MWLFLCIWKLYLKCDGCCLMTNKQVYRLPIRPGFKLHLMLSFFLSLKTCIIKLCIFFCYDHSLRQNSRNKVRCASQAATALQMLITNSDVFVVWKINSFLNEKFFYWLLQTQNSHERNVCASIKQMTVKKNNSRHHHFTVLIRLNKCISI